MTCFDSKTSARCYSTQMDDALEHMVKGIADPERPERNARPFFKARDAYIQLIHDIVAETMKDDDDHIKKINDVFGTSYTKETHEKDPKILGFKLLEKIRTGEFTSDMDDIFPGSLEMARISGRINQEYVKGWDDADVLYRGTRLSEVDNMINDGFVGNPKYYKDVFIRTTTVETISDFFARKNWYTQNTDGSFNEPCRIEYDKDYLEKHVVKQGFGFFKTGDSHEIDEPQGGNFLHEMEFRLPPSTLKADPSRMVLHLDKDVGEAQRAVHAKKYGIFKRLVYDLTRDG